MIAPRIAHHAAAPDLDIKGRDHHRPSRLRKLLRRLVGRVNRDIHFLPFILGLDDQFGIRVAQPQAGRRPAAPDQGMPQALPVKGQTAFQVRHVEADTVHFVEEWRLYGGFRADIFQPIGQLLDQFLHHLPGVFMKDLDVTIGLATRRADHVCHPAQDQAMHPILICHPCNCSGLPVCRNSAVLFNQAGDIARYYVAVGRDEQATLDGMGERVWKPGNIEIGGIMENRLTGVGHLLDDVVDNRFGNQDDGPSFYTTLESAAGPQVDQQVRLPAVNHILCRGGS